VTFTTGVELLSAFVCEFAVSALTLMVGRQEEHPACEN